MSLPLSGLLLLSALQPGPGARSATVTASESSTARPAPQDEEPTAASWMKVLKDERARSRKRRGAAEALLAMGADGAELMARYLKDAIEEARGRADREQAALVRGVQKAAGAVLERTLDKATLAEVEEQRALILTVRRDPNLSKQRIVEESEPALEWLRAHLVPHLDEVFDEDPDLIAQHGELRRALQRELLDREFHAQALEVLEDAGRERVVERLTLGGDDPGDVLDGLAVAIEVAAERAMPMTKGDRSVLEANDLLRAELSEEEFVGIEYLNTTRILIGLNALAIDLKLCDASRDHSKDMHEQGFFAHESPVEGKRTPGQRASNFGTSGSAENIAAGRHGGRSAMLGWWHSPGHHKNLLGSASRVSLGNHEDMWTNQFGR